jgi:MoaA/NifB/PqqE/SkfB family radical SAM enzyme
LVKKIVSGLPHLFQLIRLARNGKPFGFSFNLSDRCPINCDCYWRAMQRVKELSDDDVVDFVERKREEGLLLATFVGGEPYVRPRLLERVAGILPATWVVTSGTSPLLHLPGTTHFISVDGVDAATHDTVRKSQGLYDRIIKNLTRVRSEGDFPVVIHVVLNALNYRQIEPILETWRDNKLVDAVVFSTITPIRGMGADLNLTLGQRREIVTNLRRAKSRFKRFHLMSPGMIDRLEPEITRTQTPATCLTALRIPSFDAAGKRIPQCILGEKADCSKCGCVVTVCLEPFMRFDISTWRVLAKLYTPR